MKRIKYDYFIFSVFFLHTLIVWFSSYIASILFTVRKGEGLWNATKIEVLNHFVRWDSAWYLAIAREGYNEIQKTAFFPLYPMTIRVLGQIFLLFGISKDDSYVFAGLLISNIAFLIALYFVFKIAQQKYNKLIARKTILFIAIFPTSLFFSVIYSESLFLCMAAAAFYFGYNKKWVWAGIFSGLAVLTRNIGGAIVISIFILYIVEEFHGFNKKTWVHLFSICFVPLLSLMSYMLLLYNKFNDPLAFLHAQNFWGRHFMVPIKSIAYTFGSSKFDFLFIIIFLFFLFLSFKKLPIEQWLFFLLSFGLPMTSAMADNTLESMPRYVIVIFPAFIYLAYIIRERLTQMVYVSINVIFLIFLQIAFGNWYWVS